jgi:hypothetical protein
VAKRIIGLLIVMLTSQAEADWLYATPINPEVFRTRFQSAKKDADVVAEIRVLTVVCTAAKKVGDEVRSVTLQVAMQVLAVEKGPVKKNEIVVVSREVALPAGPGPRAYGYMAELRQFPFTPGVKGSVALRWDKESRAYAALAGWVPEPNYTEIPKEVGKAVVAKDSP